MQLASWAYFGLRLRGIENIPAEGPLIIVPNHQTYADPPLVAIPVRRPIYFMAWEALFDRPVLRWLIPRLRAFPVNVESTDSRAIREAARLLRAREALMIFPEGGRSPDGRLQPFKMGAFRLAVGQQASVLPVTIEGGNASWPPGRRFPRPGHITITYHPVLHPAPGLDAKSAARDLADRTRAAIASALPPGLRSRPPP